MTSILPGLDALEAGHAAPIKEFLRGQRVGLLTNHTGSTIDGIPVLEVLDDLGIAVHALFSPEHGPSGNREGIVESGHTAGGLPIYSLYGATRRPTDEMLAGITALVCDLQDVGARFYTYATTLAYTLEECARHKIAVIVLDHPNPLGGTVIEGPQLHDECRSFVGYLRVPVRHGMTLGELARLHCADKRLDLDLRIVPVLGWRRSMHWPETSLPWRRPSPNLPDYQAAAWYPGICLLEFSRVSVGRGTDAPFQIIGAPWLNPDQVLQAMASWPQKIREEVSGEAIDFVPAHEPFKDQACRGLRFHISIASDGRLRYSSLHPVALGLALLATLHQTHPHEFDEAKLRAALPLLGSLPALEAVRDGDIHSALKIARADAHDFQTRRAPFLLYR